jgi:hypothetical protein
VPTWIRVRDTSTGAEYDVNEQSTILPGVEVIKDYPPNSGPGARPRPAKPFVDKAGNPALPHSAGGADEINRGPAEPANTKEQQS